MTNDETPKQERTSRTPRRDSCLEWEPEDGVGYVIQNSPGLGAEAAWTDVEPPVTAPGCSALIVPAENPGFYRLTTPLNTL